LDGTYEAMLARVAAVFGVDAGMAEDLEKLLSVDSTNVRAHQHCAGARFDSRPELIRNHTHSRHRSIVAGQRLPIRKTG